jgi:glycosyltransferase involved in cell wall biosynthesis
MLPMETTRSSVVIPNYNRETLVGETIQNMLDQSLPPHEVIVVDDGSTDRSVEVIRSFGDRVRVIEQGNCGPGAARNAGLAAATGEYVQFMDSDDLASRNKLEVKSAALESESADIAYGPWSKVAIQGRELRFEDHVLQSQALPPSRSMLEWFVSGWSVVMQTCLFRRDLLMKAGEFRTDLMIWEDGEYLVRILLEQPRITFTPDSLVLYRLHDTGKLTEKGSSSDRKLADRARVLPWIATMLRQRGTRLGFATRRDLATIAWRLWHELKEANRLRESVGQEVYRLWCAWPAVVLQANALASRVGTHIRWRMTGARWPHSYQSCPPQPVHRELVSQLGFRSA